jgi:hypothetical protein
VHQVAVYAGLRRQLWTTNAKSPGISAEAFLKIPHGESNKLLISRRKRGFQETVAQNPAQLLAHRI